ncbi:MAG: DNA primase [Flavobacteriales bacterium]|nr:DNA primase [Flavobacteriales bacterium]
MIRQHTIDQIFSAANIEDVVGDYVKLKRSGSGFGGLCPFHNEKSPSFKVSPALGIYKCFGCGKGGNVVDFVMDVEKMAYPEALRFLANRYHIEIDEDFGNREEVSEQMQIKEALYIALEFAKNYFHNTLKNDSEGRNIGLSYFKERGLTEKTIEEFGLGYSKNNWEDFYNEAIKSGYDTEILVKAGLIKARNREGEAAEKEISYYDIYRERVMFPIFNLSGKVVGFGGRQLKKDDKSPKYINSPENEVYHKSSVLYGLSHAKKAIRTHENVYLVEGYLDVLMLYQSGIENVVATSGTSLTTEQVKIVKRFSDHVTMLYDGDKAGIKAAIRGIDLLLEGDLNVKVVVFPEGEDPDSYCRKLGGAGLQEYIEKEKKDFVLFKTEILLNERGRDPVGLSETARDVLESIVKIPDPIKRTAYIKQCANLMQFDEELMFAEAKRMRSTATREFEQQQKRTEQRRLLEAVPIVAVELSETKTKEQALIESLILYGREPFNEEIDVAGFVFSELENDQYRFENPEFAESVEQAKEYYDFNESLTEEFFTKHKSLGKIAANVLSLKYNLSPAWWEMHEIYVKPDSENYKEVVLENLNYLKLYKIAKVYKKAMEMLKDAETEEDLMIAQHRIVKILEVRAKITEMLGIEGALPE